jgi:hypothetical protein
MAFSVPEFLIDSLLLTLHPQMLMASELFSRLTPTIQFLCQQIFLGKRISS